MFSIYIQTLTERCDRDPFQMRIQTQTIQIICFQKYIDSRDF